MPVWDMCTINNNYNLSRPEGNAPMSTNDIVFLYSFLTLHLYRIFCTLLMRFRVDCFTDAKRGRSVVVSRWRWRRACPTSTPPARTFLRLPYRRAVIIIIIIIIIIIRWRRPFQSPQPAIQHWAPPSTSTAISGTGPATATAAACRRRRPSSTPVRFRFRCSTAHARTAVSGRVGPTTRRSIRSCTVRTVPPILRASRTPPPSAYCACPTA